MRRPTTLLVIAISVLACGKRPSTEPSRTETEASTPNSQCVARVDEIERALSSSARKCQTDKDCICFRGGVSKKEPCGGVTDVKTNDRFEALAKEWSSAGCNNEQVMCPAMVCEPKCNAGTCTAAGMVVQ